MIWKLRPQGYRPPKDYKHCYVAAEEEEEEEEQEGKEEEESAITKKKPNDSNHVVVTNRFISIVGAKRERGPAKDMGEDSD
jgi:hypothetical protein